MFLGLILRRFYEDYYDSLDSDRQIVIEKLK